MALPLGTIDILKSLSFFEKGKKVLDIGLGEGDASVFFVQKKLKVSATGININSYNLKTNLKEKIELKESFVTNLDFPDNHFDYVWASHVIEHEINPGLAFKEIRRVLKDGGTLVICIPPYKSKIVGGHINTGYTVGQLMYQLVLNKFNIKKGNFITYGHNICGVVKKDDHIILPNLRYDNGDVETLSHLFPINVKQGFNGNIKKINWPFRLPNIFLKYNRITKFIKKCKKI